mgnify:CR=1 FL=1
MFLVPTNQRDHYLREVSILAKALITQHTADKFTPEKVAAAAAAGLRQRRRIVWAPGLLRWVFVVLRHLPGPVWRRLPLG